MRIGRPELQNLLVARALLVLLGLGLSPHKWRNWMRWSQRSLQAQRLSHSRIPPVHMPAYMGVLCSQAGSFGGLRDGVRKWLWDSVGVQSLISRVSLLSLGGWCLYTEFCRLALTERASCRLPTATPFPSWSCVLTGR